MANAACLHAWVSFPSFDYRLTALCLLTLCNISFADFPAQTEKKAFQQL